MPYVYFVQPRELVGTMQYKIGMSELDNLSRAKSYGNGTRYLCIIECDDARFVERRLIETFRDEFICVRGFEYFEILNEADTLDLFIKIVMECKESTQKPIRQQWMDKFGFVK